MSAHPTEKLSEFIDDELAAPERARIESHLSSCSQCARVVDDLRAVVSAAGAVEDSPPASDLWPAIARRLAPRHQGPRVVAIDSRRGPRRLSFSIPQLVAASLAVALLSAGAVWMAIRDGGGTTGPSTVAVPAGSEEPMTGVTVASGSAPQVFVEYESAVADLERLLDEISDDIDPDARRAIDRNLAIIDQAIQQTREALEADPNDDYLNTHLASTMQRKIDVLQEATRLVRTST
ncbi:MAG TPA: zf-HC2 domain-containing protein [Gemmatimonadota bacterium]|nr:zf-HC2 domain-containing protein [Gemmatimonadota bacterium]